MPAWPRERIETAGLGVDRQTACNPGSASDLPLDRIVHVAEFRASLRAFLSASETVSRHWGLTPQRYLLLLMIKGAPDRRERLSFTALSRRLQLSRNTVTELCARAEEEGLIARERAEHDRRMVYLRLTREGERRLRGALVESDEHRRDFARVFRRLSGAFWEAGRR